MHFELYTIDTETSGLDSTLHSPIEISAYRLSDDSQKTWWLRPINTETIQKDALRINGHKLEDIIGHTPEGREKYRPADKVLVEIENWVMEDGASAGDRIIVGQNVNFDKSMLLALWAKCNSSGTFPFNEKYTLDTMGVQFYIDYCQNQFDTGYSLAALTKKYGIKNERAHTAAADTKATVELFRKQVEFLRALLPK